jgi:putative thioredoxin
MIDVTLQNFEAEVISASQHTPILVDFWAPWCGPCKSLGPVLEKLETAYEGRFRLVKIDSDQEQQLAQAFGVRSIPTVILMVNGKPVDGFAGALPEGKVREFLDKHVPSADEMPAESEMATAEALVDAGDTEAAIAMLQEALAANPDNDDARYDYIKLLISMGYFEDAQASLAPALARIPRPLRFDALAKLLDAMTFATTDERAQWSLDQFDAHIAQNKRDFDTRFAKARLLMATGRLTEALDELLEIIMRDKKWSDEAPRKNYVAILELLTPTTAKTAQDGSGKTAGGIELAGKAAIDVDPQAALIATYRRRLSMALN